jgi:hypothetical protein
MTGFSEKPLLSAVMKRLRVLAETIQAPLPSAEALKRLALCVMRFPESVIEQACEKLENTAQGDYKRLPTPHELQKACEESRGQAVKVTRWCGRCTLGMIRRGKEWEHCECNCPICDNSGWTQEMRAVAGFPYKEAPYAIRCPKGCRKGTEAA